MAKRLFAWPWDCPENMPKPELPASAQPSTAHPTVLDEIYYAIVCLGGERISRTFIESRDFSRRRIAARVSDDRLRELQNDIVATGGVIIRGTGGVRKIRWAAEHRGKSGSWRVTFVDYPQFGIAVLLTAFEKGEKAELTEAERNTWRAIKAHMDLEMEREHG